MKGKKEILKTLDGVKKEISERYKVDRIGLFGSFIKNNQKKSSDIDILVEFREGADIFDLVGLGQFLEEKLGQKVDIVPKSSLRLELRESILKEVAYV